MTKENGLKFNTDLGRGQVQQARDISYWVGCERFYSLALCPFMSFHPVALWEKIFLLSGTEINSLSIFVAAHLFLYPHMFGYDPKVVLSHVKTRYKKKQPLPTRLLILILGYEPTTAWRVHASYVRAASLLNNYSDSEETMLYFKMTKYIWFTLLTLHTEQRLGSDLPSLHRGIAVCIEILIIVHRFG